jgi:hypothetical protein
MPRQPFCSKLILSRYSRLTFLGLIIGETTSGIASAIFLNSKVLSAMILGSASYLIQHGLLGASGAAAGFFLGSRLSPSRNKNGITGKSSSVDLKSVGLVGGLILGIIVDFMLEHIAGEALFTASMAGVLLERILASSVQGSISGSLLALIQWPVINILLSKRDIFLERSSWIWHTVIGSSLSSLFSGILFNSTKISYSLYYKDMLSSLILLAAVYIAIPSLIMGSMLAFGQWLLLSEYITNTMRLLITGVIGGLVGGLVGLAIFPCIFMIITSLIPGLDFKSSDSVGFLLYFGIPLLFSRLFGYACISYSACIGLTSIIKNDKVFSED